MNPEDVDDMDFPLPQAPVAVDDFSNVGPKKMIFTEDESQFKRWHVFYPIYFDTDRPYGKGRKVNKELAVKNPNVLHILYIAHNLGLKTTFEPLKRHPKDFFNFGRVRINLMLDNGFYVYDDITTKKALLIKMAELFPDAQEQVGEIETYDPTVIIDKAKEFVNTGHFRK